MEATPVIDYQFENNPEPQEVGTLRIYTNFITPMNMYPTLTFSTFSCSLSLKEFIEDEESHRKQELYHFFIESGVDEFDAVTLMKVLIRVAAKVTSSVEYFSHYALSMWLSLVIVPLSESDLDNSQIEEAIRASLDDNESNVGCRPASKLGVGSLSRRIYKRKRETRLIPDQCTICLEEFKTGRKIVSLPCGHEFDNRCIVKWFKVNHVCPLCRFELPCEDESSISTASI